MLLLDDMFEKFRNSSSGSYGLFTSIYLSAPALSWYTMLNMTKVELELISDADMYFEKSIGEVEVLTFIRGIARLTISI